MLDMAIGFRGSLITMLTLLLLLALLLPLPAYCLDSEDSLIFNGLLSLAEGYDKGDSSASKPAAGGREVVASKAPATADQGIRETAAENAAADRATADKAAAERAAAGPVKPQGAAATPEGVSSPVASGVPGNAAAPPAAKSVVSQTFTLEVAQFADVQINVGPAAEKQEVGQTFSIPVDIVNTGNGSDSFTLESGFPPEYDFHFAAASAPAVAIKATPPLAAGETFHAVAVATVPQTNADGQKSSYPVRAVSTFSREVSKSRQIAFVSAAPLLRVVVETEKRKLLPGETIRYRVSMLNAGTASANRMSLKLTYSPEYELERLPEGMKPEGKGVLVLEPLELKSGQSKDIALSFLLKNEALADGELFLRADLFNVHLNKKESFLSPITVVQKVSGVTAKAPSERVVVIPGQVVSFPVVVTNTGNVRDTFGLMVKAPAEASYALYEDVNRDGKREANEPLINYVGPLAPKEEAYVMLEITTPASARDSSVALVALYVEPESAAEKMATVNLHLAYSRPIMELTMVARGGRVKPGEVASLELNCLNHGSAVAKHVILQSVVPAQLALVASDPPYSNADNGTYDWRFEDVGPGERRSIKVSYRVKPGIAVGTNMQVKHLLTYQDQLGNRY